MSQRAFETGPDDAGLADHLVEGQHLIDLAALLVDRYFYDRFMSVFRCNPFFIQHRRGVNEVEFRVVKIRSLPKTFHHRKGKHEMHDHELGWWSKVLRNSHLDELPQVLNIIAGSMSVVGPRPMIEEVVDTLEPEDRITRSTVKPGLTGPWQISTMGGQSLHDHPELDNQYVEKASLGSDVRIILITAATVVGKKHIEPKRLTQRLGW